MLSVCVTIGLVDKRVVVVKELKELQAQTEPIMNCFSDPEFAAQMNSTR